MKRISLFAIVMLTIVPGLTKAHFYNSTSVRYRTRWSPYAFTNKTSGLISGNYEYSPYAFTNKSNGLIRRDVRYSPYAFTHKTSGLIRDDVGYSPYAFHYKHSGLVVNNEYRGSYSYCRPPVVIVHTVDNSPCSRSYSPGSSGKTDITYQQLPTTRRERLLAQRNSKKQIKTAKEQDSKDIICRYLKSRNIDDFKTTGMLSIEGRVVNVNFQLKDKNIMITYWDLDEVQSLLQQDGYHRTYLERHEKQWQNLCNEYTQAGGKIFPITSADEKEILAKLTLCSELNGG
ncbi:MAG: hypothetical protein RQ760_11180 [Sedimentisphaerales bacterium]|nr:hypothetical protein [Sedimentisphaerales bacterium]